MEMKQYTQQKETGDETKNKARYDVAVIGGGPAGYVAAIRAAQLGARVILFERDAVGGTCLNRGCIPTKTYLKTAEYIRHIKGAAARGIIADSHVRVDMPKVVSYKDRVVKTLTAGVSGLLKSSAVEVIKGDARLTAPTEVECGGQSYTADKIILCGGSKVMQLPVPGADSRTVMTSDDILELTQLPQRLAVIGGGVVGCELASAFASFGCKVTVVELCERILANLDRDISAELEKSLKKSGVKILCGRRVERIESRDGETAVVTDQGEVVCDRVLLSAGRTADLSCLGDMAGTIRTEKGKVVVDDAMRTNVPGIYACGDITGRVMLAHAAFKMGETAAENAVTGRDKTCDLRLVPSCIYTHPEAAGVGLTEEQARQKASGEIRTGFFSMAGNGRSVASGERQGFVKVVADGSGEILGVHMVGGDASEMIAEAAALMAMKATVDEVTERVIHPHPSYSEALGEACADVLGRSIHQPARKPQDR